MSYKFENHNDWYTFKFGKLEAFVNFRGQVERMHHGRICRAFAGAEAYISARPKISASLEAWKSERSKAVAEWKHTAPHYRFDCDGGALAVRVNGGAVLNIGCGSDGNHPVYIVKDVPPFFSNTGVNLGHCTIEPLDYDCDGGKPLCSVNVKSAWFYRHEGAVAIVVEEVEKDCVTENDEEVTLRRISSAKRYPSGVCVFGDDGECSDISLDRMTDGVWTDAEAEADAREMLRDHGFDDSTAEHWLISTIAAIFPREEAEA